jgi:hypothetical protein
LTVGGYTGRQPSKIYFSADSGDIVTGLAWASWTAAGATGSGISSIQDCVPSCAAGTATTVPTTITLSSPVNGRFTVITEVRDGKTLRFQYPGGPWPLEAS